jgi:hypothetical protein
MSPVAVWAAVPKRRWATLCAATRQSRSEGPIPAAFASRSTCSTKTVDITLVCGDWATLDKPRAFGDTQSSAKPSRSAFPGATRSHTSWGSGGSEQSSTSSTQCRQLTVIPTASKVEEGLGDVQAHHKRFGANFCEVYDTRIVTEGGDPPRTTAGTSSGRGRSHTRARATQGRLL